MDLSEKKQEGTVSIIQWVGKESQPDPDRTACRRIPYRGEFFEGLTYFKDQREL